MNSFDESAPYQAPKPQRETQLEIAIRLARDYGLYVFPVSAKHGIRPNGKLRSPTIKMPLTYGWRARSTNIPAEIQALWEECPDGAAVGIDCGKSELLVLDPDRKPGEADGIAAWRELFESEQLRHGPIEPQPPVIATPNGGMHVWFRQPAGVKLGNSEGSLPDGINVRGVGGLVLAPGAVIAQGKAIALPSDDGSRVVGYAIELADGRVMSPAEPVPLGRYEVVAGSLSAIPEAPSWLVNMLEPCKRLKPSKAALTPGEQGKELIKLRYALPYIPAHDRQKTWRPVGMAMRWALGEDGFPLFDEWSRTAPGKYHFDQNVDQWNSFAMPGDGRRDDRAVVDLGTVYHLAEKHGWPGIKGDLGLQAELRAFDAAELLAAVKASPAPAPVPFQQPLQSILEPVEPFSFDLLPVPLQGWAKDISERMQCPPDFIGVGALVGLGTVVGPRITIRPLQNSDWTEAANLYGLIVGRPGFMKSPAMKTALASITRLEQATRGRHQEAMLRFEAVQIVKKKNLKRAESTSDNIMGSNADSGFESAVQNVLDAMKIGDTDAPIQKRYITNNASPASLMELLRQNPDGILLFRDEIKALLQSFEKEDTSELREIFLTCWNGLSFYTSDRIERGLDLHVPSACLSVLGSIQPGVIAPYIRAALSEGEGADGMMQRFQVMVWPDGAEKFELIDQASDRKLAARAHGLFVELDQLTPAACGAQTDQIDGKDIGRPYLRLALDAQDAFNEWYLELMRRTRKADDDELPAFTAHRDKYRKLVPTLALLLHLAENGTGPVSKAALEKALAWAKYLESHARRVYTSAPNAAVIAAKVIVAKAKKGELPGGFTARDIYRKHWAQTNNAELVQEALDLLEERGWIKSLDLATSGKGKTIYYLRTE